MSNDAIIAIATAPGRGGVGVIRLSIPPVCLSSPEQLPAFLQATFRLKPTPRHAHFVRLPDEDGATLDEGLLLYFPAPASFTGDHVLEFQGHGGPALLQLCLRRFLKLGEGIGLRMARPGEFTERAFLNGKLDLAQAEAVADLVDAGSARAARAAMASLQGEFSRQVNALADELVHLRLLVEATLDFPEEEIEFLRQSDALNRLSDCASRLSDLLKKAGQSARLASGLRIVIAGQPNVGKSSLLNALSGEDRAIVTSIAGTTRDTIHQDIELDGIRITLIDTAGLRATDDPVEQIGIARTLKEIELADLLLVIFDASQDRFEQPAALDGVSFNGPRLQVVNKVDLLANRSPVWQPDGPCVFVSAKTGEGLADLRQQIFSAAQCDPHADLSFLARQRHIQALHAALGHLELAAEHAQHADLRLDLFAEELRLSHDALGEITGRVLPDDLLGLIFSRFCIGK